MTWFENWKVEQRKFMIMYPDSWFMNWALSEIGQLKSLFNRIHSNRGDFDLMQRFCHKISHSHSVWKELARDFFCENLFRNVDPWRNSCSSSWKVFSWNTVSQLRNRPNGFIWDRQVEQWISENSVFFVGGGGKVYRGLNKWPANYISGLQKPMEFQSRVIKISKKKRW